MIVVQDPIFDKILEASADDVNFFPSLIELGFKVTEPLVQAAFLHIVPKSRPNGDKLQHVADILALAPHARLFDVSKMCNILRGKVWRLNTLEDNDLDFLIELAEVYPEYIVVMRCVH